MHDPNSRRKRPSAAWYILPVVILVAGAGFGGNSFLALGRQVKDMQRVVLPADRDIDLKKGEFVVYGETKSTVDGKEYRAGKFNVKCNPDLGRGATMRTRSTKSSYSFGSYTGESLFTLDVPQDGTYKLTCGTSENSAVLAIGKGIGGSIVQGVLGILAGVFGAIAVFVVVLVLRISSARAAARAAAGPFPPAYGGEPGPPHPGTPGYPVHPGNPGHPGAPGWPGNSGGSDHPWQ